MVLGDSAAGAKSTLNILIIFTKFLGISFVKGGGGGVVKKSERDNFYKWSYNCFRNEHVKFISFLFEKLLGI